jgi:hypothetical protein
MSPREMMETIEGPQFAAEVNLAAGFEAFHRSIQSHSLFRDLAGLMKDHPAVFKTVLVRLNDLSRKPIRMQYENPYDSAMAAYLMAADGVDPEVAAVAAEAVSKAPNCWWASQVSSGIARAASEASAWDLKLIFGQLDQARTPNVVTQHTAMALSWLQVKLLIYYLQLDLAVYESQYGKIVIPAAILPPPPGPLPPEMENDPVARASTERAREIYALWAARPEGA